MRTLPCPDRTEAREQLQLAIRPYVRKGVAKGYNASAAQIEAVISLYDAYDQANGAPSDDLKGPLLADDLKNAIQLGYNFTQTNRKLASLRVAVMKGVVHCPVCGITRPRELDHFIPKEIYKPLSVYIRNLIPLCHDCNHSKAQHAGNGATQFIHPYFDALPDFQFMRATVSLEGGAVSADFDVDPNVEIPGPLRERLDFQLGRLKLNERYQPEINTFLVGHATALTDAYGAAQAAGVSYYLDRQADVERGVFHLNHWRPVLLGALATHQDFCDGGFVVLTA